MWALSPHGTPRSFRHVNGHGVHTFRWVNENGDSKLVRYHFRTQQGLASLTWDEAQSAAGQNSDYHRADLWDNIKDGNFPEWEVGVQIMNEEDVLKYGFDLLDPTKIVPEEYVPITPVGKLVLNRNPKNYFAETEQIMVSLLSLASLLQSLTPLVLPLQHYPRHRLLRRPSPPRSPFLLQGRAPQPQRRQPQLPANPHQPPACSRQQQPPRRCPARLRPAQHRRLLRQHPERRLSAPRQ